MPLQGVKIACPATAYDALGILRTAVRSDDPVMIFEHKLLYGSKGARAESGTLDASSDIPDEDYTVPLGKAVVRKEGKDVTITERGRKLYKIRGKTVEPVFGQIKDVVKAVKKLMD